MADSKNCVYALIEVESIGRDCLIHWIRSTPCDTEILDCYRSHGLRVRGSGSHEHRYVNESVQGIHTLV